MVSQCLPMLLEIIIVKLWNIILIGQAALKYIRKNNRLLGIAFDFLGINAIFKD
jgi:hypothetical protein